MLCWTIFWRLGIMFWKYCCSNLGGCWEIMIFSCDNLWLKISYACWILFWKLSKSIFSYKFSTTKVCLDGWRTLNVVSLLVDSFHSWGGNQPWKIYCAIGVWGGLRSFCEMGLVEEYYFECYPSSLDTNCIHLDLFY